jgi:TorA maturation chaperone TorD
MEDSMAKKTKASGNHLKREDAQAMVSRVLTAVFQQNPSQKTIEDVAEKVLKRSPKQATA